MAKNNMATLVHTCRRAELPLLRDAHAPAAACHSRMRPPQSWRLLDGVGVLQP